MVPAGVKSSPIRWESELRGCSEFESIHFENRCPGNLVQGQLLLIDVQLYAPENYFGHKAIRIY